MASNSGGVEPADVEVPPELLLFGRDPVKRTLNYIHVTLPVPFLEKNPGEVSSGIDQWEVEGNDHHDDGTRHKEATVIKDVRHLLAYDDMRRALDWDGEVKKKRDRDTKSTFINPKWKGMRVYKYKVYTKVFSLSY